MKSGWFLEQVHELVRTRVSFATEDRVFATDIEEGIKLIRAKALIRLLDSFSEKQKVSLRTPLYDVFETF